MRAKTGVSIASAKSLQTCKIWSPTLKVDGRQQRIHAHSRKTTADAHSRKTNAEDEDSLSVEGEDQSSVDKGENWLTKLSPKMECSIS